MIRLLVFLLFVSLPSASHADEKKELEHLRSTVERMERTIEELKAQIGEMRRQQASAPEATPAPTAGAVEAPPALARKEGASEKPVPPELADHDTTTHHRETILGDNVSAPRPGNAVLDPTYAGFTPLFGTTSWIKLGGYAKLDSIIDSTKMGNPNKFVTNGIPVDGDTDYGKSREYALHAKQTRVNFELRSPTRLGSLRIVYENDFFGNSSSPGMEYNLRHFYGQVANLTVGQTWTAFLDPDAIPDTLDSAGPGVQATLRQPQVRYAFTPRDKAMHLVLSVEQPNADVSNLPTNGSARNRIPDFAAHWRWEAAPGHVQVGGLARSLSWDGGASGEDSSFAWGTNASVVLNTWNKDSVVGNLTYGKGIGRYMQDLPSGSGAVVDANGNLHSLPAWGGYFGYRHFWADAWRSEVTYGYADLDNRVEQGAKAYDHTHYAQANLIWSPVQRCYVGVEYLFGERTTRDGSDGDVHRGQVSFQYKLL